MLSHMKTTINMADNLFKAAKRFATQKNTTLKDVIESALRSFLESSSGPNKSFKLKDCAFQGQGLHPEMQGEGWDAIQHKIYEGRGS